MIKQESLRYFIFKENPTDSSFKASLSSKKKNKWMFQVTLSEPGAVAASASTHELRASTESIFPLQLLPNKGRWALDMQRRKAVVSLLTDPYPSLKAPGLSSQAQLPLTAVLSWVLGSTTFLIATRSAYRANSRKVTHFICWQLMRNKPIWKKKKIG